MCDQKNFREMLKPMYQSSTCASCPRATPAGLLDRDAQQGAVLRVTRVLDLLVEIPADLPPSEGDPALLTQVLRNLYENAVKYSPGGCAVRTTASITSPEFLNVPDP
mgnify:CR=1 FL=1